ncbi:MAG: nucleotidyltransferase domain-containing protein [Candidatus Micrarchaeota archaeon]
MDAIEILSYSSAAQAFRVLLKYPKRQFSIRELAREARAPFSSVLRAVRLMERAGLLEMGKVGRSKAVRLHRSAYTKRIAGILEAGVSLQKFAVEKLKRMLKSEKKVKEAWLFGSVARGEEKLESDIDIAMVVEAGYDPTPLVFRIVDEYGAKVVPLLFRTKRELDRFLEGKEKVTFK